MSDAPASERSIRSLGLTVYMPSFLFAVGQGAVLPIVALAAREVGASIPVAGLVVALRGIGTMAFDIPAGALVSRLGERRAMSLGTAALVVALAGCVVSTSVLPFAAFMFLMGCGWSVWLLARLAYVSDVMPAHLRGRALSTLGGINRIGTFVGPFLGAGAITAMGVDGAYVVHIVSAILGSLVLFLVKDPLTPLEVPEHHGLPFRTVIREHGSTFSTAGVGALVIGVLRASRHAVLPLWAAQAGIDAAGVGIIFGIASGLDMTLFYPAGSVSDRFGRKVVAIPCMATLATGFLLMPLARDFRGLVLIGLLLGFGNGLGSGIVMTLGADFAPLRGRAEFLGVWRMVGDVGTSAGPMVAAAVAGAAGLASASMTVGALGLAGALLVLVRMPEPLHRVRASEGEDGLDV